MREESRTNAAFLPDELARGCALRLGALDADAQPLSDLKKNARALAPGANVRTDTEIR